MHKLLLVINMQIDVGNRHYKIFNIHKFIRQTLWSAISKGKEQIGDGNSIVATL